MSPARARSGLVSRTGWSRFGRRGGPWFRRRRAGGFPLCDARHRRAREMPARRGVRSDGVKVSRRPRVRETRGVEKKPATEDQPGFRARASLGLRVARRLRGLLDDRQVVVVARHLHEVSLLRASAALQPAVVQDLPKRPDAKLGEVGNLVGGSVRKVLRARGRGAGGEAGRRAKKRERGRSETHRALFLGPWLSGAWVGLDAAAIAVFRELGKRGGGSRRNHHHRSFPFSNSFRSSVENFGLRHEFTI